jgi:FMN phosphatase YigB (HAD superfamily)
MTNRHDVVFLFDVDNTLFDHDRFRDDFGVRLEQAFGAAGRDRYWTLFEALRSELGYADYLGALQRYRAGLAAAEISDPELLQMSAFLLDYPFAERIYDGALNALAHVSTWGPTVVLSDGDVVYQPHKIRQSGLWQAFAGRVLIYVHKQQMLADLERRYPARRYVMVDDKLSILAAMKRVLKQRLTSVFVRQGHYALDVKNTVLYPAADLSIDRIGDLPNYDFAALFDVAAANSIQENS